MGTSRLFTVAGLALLLAATPTTVAHAATSAPGAPGGAPDYAPADKAGFGTAYGARTSRVWFTVQREGGLGELFYPDLNTPSVRRLEFVVSDGRHATRVDRSRTTAPDPRSPTYEQTAEDAGHWRLVTRYVSDPDSATVLVDVDFASLDHRPRQVFVRYDPALSGNGADDTGATGAGQTLVARDTSMSTTLSARPAFTATSSGYLGSASDGWTDLAADGRLDHRYATADTPGNLVQTAQLALSHGHATLSLGFDRQAVGDFDRTAQAYAGTWHRYLAGLRRPPDSLQTDQQRRLYLASVMVLAASEDKANPGAYVASPTMPWRWGQEQPSGPYHLVWSRDLYEIATALLATGDRAGADRALDFLFTRQQRPDGSFPQNSDVTGRPVWTGLQLDEVAYPIVLAAQLGRTDATTWSHVRQAADFLLGYAGAPATPQERWENQSGYSPATIAAEIAGLVQAAGIARANHDTAAADRYLATADDWQRRVESWTVTRTGPYSPRPYYLRLTKDGQPDAGTTYAIGDSGPSAVDQRAVVDPSFLELVRLGIKPAPDPVIAGSLAVVDRQLSYYTAVGRFWHRFTFDGYGETVTGGPWTFDLPADSRITRGRGWPIFNGERGEYAIAAGDPATARAQLRTMAATANGGLMLPEQVWDTQPPNTAPPGTGTFSATPLAWTHAQYVRLAVDLAAGAVTEQPPAVACRYLHRC